MKGRKRPKSSSMDQRQKAILSFAMSMFMNSGETEESAAKEVCRKIYFYDFKLLHKEKGKID